MVHAVLFFLFCLVCMVIVEPASLRHQLQSDGGTVGAKSRSSASEDGRTEELKLLTVSSSHFDRTEARVSSSAHESRCLRCGRVFVLMVFSFHSNTSSAYMMPHSLNKVCMCVIRHQEGELREVFFPAYFHRQTPHGAVSLRGCHRHQTRDG